MDGTDLSEYFREHPERWAGAVGAAALAILVFLRRAARSPGFFGKTWNILMVGVQVAIVIGLVRARNQETEGWS